VTRSQTAFVIAPLWVPLLVTPFTAVYVFPYAAQFMWVLIAGGLSALFAYFGTYALGRPLFTFLNSRNWTALWIAVISGGGIGIITWFAFLICFVLFLGEGLGGIQMVLHPNLSQLLFLGIPALLGALVAGTIWIIMRPELRRDH
jgi:hypothetical protein